MNRRRRAGSRSKAKGQERQTQREPENDINVHLRRVVSIHSGCLVDSDCARCRERESCMTCGLPGYWIAWIAVISIEEVELSDTIGAAVYPLVRLVSVRQVE